MNRNVLIVGVVVVVALVAGGLWFWFAPSNAELTGDVNEEVERIADGDTLSTPEATEEPMTPEAEADEADTAPEADDADATPEADDADDEMMAETEEAVAAADEDAAAEESTDDTEMASASEGTIFRIDSQRSTAEFNIDEVLRGEDFTVVGTTNQIAGDILVNPDDPASSEIGEILINARDLTTDADGRNRALRNFILRSSNDEFEFISFQPTAIENMPDQVTVGETFEFQVIGDLTIIDTTQEVTFDVTVTPLDETEIEGVAEAVILYQDFDITIPDVPFVASVEDEVTLRLDFIAASTEQAA